MVQKWLPNSTKRAKTLSMEKKILSFEFFNQLDSKGELQKYVHPSFLDSFMSKRKSRVLNFHPEAGDHISLRKRTRKNVYHAL